MWKNLRAEAFFLEFPKEPGKKRRRFPFLTRTVLTKKKIRTRVQAPFNSEQYGSLNFDSRKKRREKFSFSDLSLEKSR